MRCRHGDVAGAVPPHPQPIVEASVPTAESVHGRAGCGCPDRRHGDGARMLGAAVQLPVETDTEIPSCGVDPVRDMLWCPRRRGLSGAGNVHCLPATAVSYADVGYRGRTCALSTQQVNVAADSVEAVNGVLSCLLAGGRKEIVRDCRDSKPCQEEAAGDPQPYRDCHGASGVAGRHDSRWWQLPEISYRFPPAAGISAGSVSRIASATSSTVGTFSPCATFRPSTTRTGGW